MTPDRLKDIREKLCLSGRAFGRLIERKESNIREMEAGTRPIPPDIADWANRLGSFLEHNPPPQKTR